MVRVVDQHGGEYVEGSLLVAFRLAVEGRDGQIDPRIQPIGRGGNGGRKQPFGIGVFVAAHACGPGIVELCGVGTATGDRGS